jgi:hypothetical protein
MMVGSGRITDKNNDSGPGNGEKTKKCVLNTAVSAVQK